MATFINDNLLLSFFLLGLSVCTTSVASYSARHQKGDRNAAKTFSRSQTVVRGKYYRLACLIEDAPRSSLRGQAYHLAAPLMTPFACPLEDAPTTSLKGQAYELAIPLMTPFACIVAQYWREFYSQNLRKPGINYWDWRDKPESDQFCRELSLLLSLPEPPKYARQVLEALATGKSLFFKPLHGRGEIGNILSALADSINDGKFAHLDWRVQTAMRKTFKQWHELAIQQIGVKALGAVYRLCYGTSWEKIQQIFDEGGSVLDDFIADTSAPWWKVLGVSSAADSEQVEKAYKTLVRLWHPDRNQHPYATQVTSRINVAYARYRVLHPVSAPIEPTSNKNYLNFWKKIPEWLKLRVRH